MLCMTYPALPYTSLSNLRVASCKLRVASCKLRVASCELRVASYSFKACKLQYIHLRYLASKQKWKTKSLMLNSFGHS